MNRILYLAVPAAVCCATPAYTATYHTVESAQKACFPEGGEFISADVVLTRAQMKAIEKDSGIRVRMDTQRVWKVKKGSGLIGWFILDEVLGKHEFITWALALHTDGSTKAIEILEYRETYGYEIRNANWRSQFTGKAHGAKLKLDDDIKNISGATLSCRHIADGVKRLLSLHEFVLKN